MTTTRYLVLEDSENERRSFIEQVSRLQDIVQRQKLELAQARDAFDDAVALLRDWEDYDPADRECTWKQRRDEFLAEHEEAGR